MMQSVSPLSTLYVNHHIRWFIWWFVRGTLLLNNLSINIKCLCPRDFCFIVIFQKFTSTFWFPSLRINSASFRIKIINSRTLTDNNNIIDNNISRLCSFRRFIIIIIIIIKVIIVRCVQTFVALSKRGFNHAEASSFNEWRAVVIHLMSTIRL